MFIVKNYFPQSFVSVLFYLIIIIECTGYKKCKIDDPALSNCIRKIMESLRSKMSTGAPEIDVPPLEPLSIPLINLSGNEEDFLLKFFDVEITGLSDFLIEDLRPVMDNLTMEITFHVPKLSFLGEYKMRGTILRIMINTTGTANLTFWNVPFTVNVEADLREGEDKKSYIYINELNNSIQTPSKAYLKFGNIFNGDQRREKILDNLLNENWSSIFNMYKSIPQIGLTRLFMNITNKICSQTPFNEIFLT